MPQPSPEIVQVIDKLLLEIDVEQLRKGKPMLSVLVRHDDGQPGGAFWQSVLVHNLRRPGERNADLVARLTRAAHDYYRGPGRFDPVPEFFIPFLKSKVHT